MNGNESGGNKPGVPVTGVGNIPWGTTLIHRKPGKVTGGVPSTGMIKIPNPNKTGGGNK